MTVMQQEEQEQLAENETNEKSCVNLEKNQCRRIDQITIAWSYNDYRFDQF